MNCVLVFVAQDNISFYHSLRDVSPALNWSTPEARFKRVLQKQKQTAKK